jgi:hypothetical protein
MITIFRSDSAMVVMKGRARDVGIDFLFESQSVRAAQKHSMQAVRSSPASLPTPPYEYGDSSSTGA